MDNAQRIVDACENAFDANKDDCNKFLKAVAASLTVIIPSGANANQIVDFLSNTANGWTALDDGDGATAKAKADTGLFVVTGLRASEFKSPHTNGHVCVIVKGGLDANGFPTGYWGSITPGLAQKNASIRKVFQQDDAENVHYFTKSLP